VGVGVPGYMGRLVSKLGQTWSTCQCNMPREYQHVSILAIHRELVSDVFIEPILLNTPVQPLPDIFSTPQRQAYPIPLKPIYK
jgi:hypothetical protein